ncbi:MAG: S9 family peptidase, partial [Actinomycetota bacterium]|nr:S9 family peptidase [Actinomycetota bacterium]
MAEATPSLIPVEHFFENPEKAGGQISPDGKRLSYLAPEENRLNVWVRTIGRDDDVCVTHEHVRGISGYFWSRDSTRILYVQDDGGDENFHVLAAEVASPDQPSTDLTPFPGVRAQLVDVPHGDPDHLLVSLNKRDPAAFDVYRLTITTSELELVAENPGNIGSWITDVGGRLLAAVTQTPTGDNGVLVRAEESEEFRSLREFANEDDVNVFGFTPDGTALFVGTAEGSDLSRLCTLDVTTAELTVLDADDEADLGRPFLDDVTGELLGVVYLRDRLVFHPVDDTFADVWAKVDA